MFYAVVEIVMRFSDTDLSLLIRLCVIEVKSEVVIVNSVLYSCKTLKTSEMNDKEINVRLMVTKDFNASMLVEKIITYRRGPLTFGKWTRKTLL